MILRTRRLWVATDEVVLIPMHKTSFLGFFCFTLWLLLLLLLLLLLVYVFLLLFLIGKSLNCFYNLRTFNESVNINTIIIIFL